MGLFDNIGEEDRDEAPTPSPAPSPPTTTTTIPTAPPPPAPPGGGLFSPITSPAPVTVPDTGNWPVSPTTPGGGLFSSVGPDYAPTGGPVSDREFDVEASTGSFTSLMEDPSKIVEVETDPDLHEDLLQFTQMLYNYGFSQQDEELVAIATDARTVLGFITPPELAQKYGLTNIPSNPSIPDPTDPDDPFSGGWWSDVKARAAQGTEATFGDTWFGRNVGGPVMRFADTASRGSRAGIRNIIEDPANPRAWAESAGALAEGITYGAGGNIAQAAGLGDYGNQPILRELEERHGGDDAYIQNFREALGLDPNVGGRVAGLFDTIATAITDPYTWVGIGAASKAQAGLDAVRRAGFSDDIVRAVRRDGFRVLDEQGQEAVKRQLMGDIAQANALRRQGVLRRGPRDLDFGQIESLAQKSLDRIEKGVGTLRVGTRNVRIPGVDSAINRMRPRQVEGVSRLGPVGRAALEGDEDAAREIFGEGVTSIERIEPKPGVEESAVFDARDRGGVVVAGNILDDAGETVGKFERILHDDGSVSFESMVIDPRRRDKKLATKFLEDQVEALEANGFGTIRLNAIDDGVVVWPKKGFRPDPESPDFNDWADEVIDNLEERRLAFHASSKEAIDAETLRDQIMQAKRTGDGSHIDMDLYNTVVADVPEVASKSATPADDLGRMYHGSPTLAEGEMPSVKGAVETPGTVWFSSSDEVASGFTSPREYGEPVFYDELGEEIVPGPVVEAGLTLKNPKIIDAGGKQTDDVLLPNQTAAVAAAKSEGHDGIIIHNAREWGSDYDSTVVAVFDDAAIGPVRQPGREIFGREIIGGDDAFIPMVRHLDPDAHLRAVGKGPGGRVKASLAERLRAAAEAPKGSPGRRGARVITAPARALGAITPRSAIRRVLGRRTEEAYDAIRVSRSSGPNIAMEDMFARIGPAADRAAREMGAMDSADDFVREGLEAVVEEGETSLSAALRVADEIEEAGFAATADYLRITARLREEVDAAAVRGGLDVERLRESYFPRTLTDEGREALEGLSPDDPVFARMGLDVGKMKGREARFYQPRTFMPEATIEEANRELAKLLKLHPDTKLFEDNVVAAFAKRGESAYRAAADADMLARMGDEVIVVGDRELPMVAKRPWTEDGVPDLNWKAPEGYVKLDVLDSNDFYAHRTIAREIETMHGFFTNNQQLRAAQEFMQNWSKTWGAYATAPLLDGFGFHSRNTASNVILNLLGGIANPAHYLRATAIQKDMVRAFHHMRKTGASFDEALDKIGLDAAQKATIKALREHEVVSSGWFDDISPKTKAPRPRGKSGFRGYDGAWDFLQNNIVVKSGRKLGSAVEHNARIAHFIGKIDAGLSPASAARSMRQFLFDYSDLTPLEEWAKNVSRFYTFMRKNTAVQLWSLARYPGRVNAIQRAVSGGDGGLASALGLGPSMTGQPEYSRQRGDSSFLGDVLGGEPKSIIGGIESPLAAATETLQPIVQIAGLLSGEGSFDGFVRSLYEISTGGPASFIDAIYTQLSDFNFAFGYEESEDSENLGTEATARRWFDAIIGPVWSQVDTFVERLTEGEGVGPIGNNPSQYNAEFGHEAAILANILGLNHARLDSAEEDVRDWMYMLRGELDLLLEQARESARERYIAENPEDPDAENFISPVPSMDDLRRIGLVPDLPDTVSRAPSVITEEKIREAQVKGLPTDDLEAELAERLADESRLGYQIDEETGEFTTRHERIEEMARGLGQYTESGSGSVSGSTMALWNRDHPDDLALRDDGTPYDVYDVEVLWPLATSKEVKDWLISQGGDPGSSLRVAEIKSYNDAHSVPYIRNWDDKLDAGYLPSQGVLVREVDGERREWWPPGQNASNWGLAGSASGPSALGATGGTSALFAPAGE